MKTVFITGCSGYVGSLLVLALAKRSDVDLVIGLDKIPLPENLHDIEKLHFVQGNTSSSWEDEVARFKPNFVVHCAWQIRELYNDSAKQELWNINGSHQVFDFAFNQTGIEKLVHISSVASYGAYKDNTREKVFTEENSLRPSKYKYAEEKRIAEEMLSDMYEKYIDNNTNLPEVFILRPASITGKMGRARTTFNLQSVLSGKAKDSIFSRSLTKVLSVVPVTPLWTRQFVHEGDVIGSIEHLLFNTSVNLESGPGIDVINLCPTGEPITGSDMAKILGKKFITLPPLFYRIIFSIAFNFTFGKIPTPRGSYMTYAYPIVVDGSKLTKKYKYNYKYTSQEAIIN